MQKKTSGLDFLPMLAFLAYWLYAGLFAAVVTGDPRLVKLGLITLPVIAAMAAAVYKTAAARREGGPAGRERSASGRPLRE